MDALLAERPLAQRTDRTRRTPTPAVEDASELAAVIGMIYDAALAPAKWTEALESCRAFVGGMSATIFGKSVTGVGGQVYHQDGRTDPQHAALYFDKYAPIDPSNTLQVFAEIEEAVVTSNMLDVEEFNGSRFAREWALPAGLVDMVVAPIERRGNWAAMFGVFRHERDGIGDETAQRRVSLLAPHVRRAVAIGQAVGTAAAEAASFSDTLDGLAAGVFLVDAEARLVHANAAGRLMLGTSGAVSASHDGTLRIERTNLRRLLPGADAAAPAIATDSLAIEAADGTRYVAHVLPLSDGARRLAGARYDAVAAFFVRPAGFEPKSVPAAIAKAFDLTPSELRVVLSTVHHDGVAEIAEALGIGEATVRTHLHRVFGKTETKRQADLVKLVAGFASPLAAR